MKERPILFSTEMVRAILSGQKTQTRRVIKSQPERTEPGGRWSFCISSTNKSQERKFDLEVLDPNGNTYTYREVDTRLVSVRCPYGLPGDRLWVRETWAVHPFYNKMKPRELISRFLVTYRASEVNESHYLWRPSIFMPRWASRITLEITKVRIERLHSISSDDAYAEGFPPNKPGEIELPRTWYRELWDEINAKRGFGWDTNPWVWVIEFQVVSTDKTS